MDKTKKIERPVNGRKLSGVCLAVANYFGIDANIVRLLWVIFTLFFVGIGIVFYIVCIFLIPEEDDGVIDGTYEEKE